MATAADEEGAAVVVYLYDLSMGMARQFSGSFLGKQIDGIWYRAGCCSQHVASVTYLPPFYPLLETRHTAVVVYGREWLRPLFLSFLCFFLKK